jgi:hypothetical protein
VILLELNEQAIAGRSRRALQAGLSLDPVAHRIRCFADFALHLAGQFFSRAFGLSRPVAGDLAHRFLHGAFDLFRCTFHTIFVHNGFLKRLSCKQTTPGFACALFTDKRFSVGIDAGILLSRLVMSVSGQVCVIAWCIQTVNRPCRLADCFAFRDLFSDSVRYKHGLFQVEW